MFLEWGGQHRRYHSCSCETVNADVSMSSAGKPLKMNPSSSGTQGQEFINWQCALLAGLIIKYPDLTLALARAIRSGDDRRSNFRTAIERHASLLDPDFNVTESCPYSLRDEESRLAEGGTAWADR